MKQLKTLQNEVNAILEKRLFIASEVFEDHLRKAIVEVINKLSNLHARNIKCQNLDCRKNSIGKFREGFHWVWLCEKHGEGRRNYSEVKDD